MLYNEIIAAPRAGSLQCSLAVYPALWQRHRQIDGRPVPISQLKRRQDALVAYIAGLGEHESEE